jgi:hypothetical protein
MSSVLATAVVLLLVMPAHAQQGQQGQNGQRGQQGQGQQGQQQGRGQQGQGQQGQEQGQSQRQQGQGQQLARGRYLGAGDPIPGLRGFSVVLVQGDLKTGATSDNVPAAAAKALADLKDFLPYRNYRLLDTQWTVGSGHIAGRLRGAEGKEYDVELTTQRGSTSDTPVTVTRFVLHEVVPNAPNASVDRLSSLVTNGLVAPSQIQQLNDQSRSRGTFGALFGSRAVIDTTFSMNIGETVVVGTSRLQGDTALIVLLTAVSRDTTPRGR